MQIAIKNNPAVAVIGNGYWGKNLVRNFNSLGALKLICDKNQDQLDHFESTLPEIKRCIAFNSVLADKEINGVVIATPAETHFTLVREALMADKHVFVEKPLALDEKQGEKLIKLAAERQRILMVGHLLQYHPVFVRLKELVHQGELGRINYIYSNRLNLGKIRREENILWSFAPHDISMILALAGELPESIEATGGNYLHRKIADVTTTHLVFPSGLRAHIFVSWLHPFKEQKLVVVGDKKMAVFDDTQPWEEKLLLYPHRIDWQNNIPIPAKAKSERVTVPQSEPLMCECLHFLECVQNNTPPKTDGKEGLAVLRILNAAQSCLNAKEAPEHDAFPSRPECRDFWAHDTSVIDDKVHIGRKTKIWHFSHILSGSVIGDQCNIGQNVVIGPDVSIGRQCKIQNNVSVYKGVTLEDGVFCGPSMVFTNIYNPRAEIRKMDQIRTTLVRYGATLGANSTIVCGVTIGRHAFVAAGAVVNRNVPDHALVAGNPAKRIGWVCACGERLTDKCICPVCGNRYCSAKNGLEPVG